MKLSEQFKKAIETFLEKKASEDELFAKSYHKKGKSIEDCCYFIIDQVKKSGFNGFDNDEIYGMAIHYYDEDDITFEKHNCQVVVNLSDHTKDELEKKAEEEYKRKKIAELEAKEKKDKERQKQKAEEKKKKAVEEGQLSLFDF